jgi:hypothetical protein
MLIGHMTVLDHLLKVNMSTVGAAVQIADGHEWCRGEVNVGLLVDLGGRTQGLVDSRSVTLPPVACIG